MAADNKSKPSNSNKKRKNYLPYNKAVKKGAYPLRPGVEGFFITCDGGRENQASHEAIDVIDSYYEDLVEGTQSKVEQIEPSKKPSNKVTKFTYSDSSGSDTDDEETSNDRGKENSDVQTGEDKDKNVIATCGDGSDESRLESKVAQGENEEHDKKEAEAPEPPAKRQCTESDAPNGNLSRKVEQKSVDKLIEDELAELGDKSKRRFIRLDTGCNGVIFIQMRKRDGDPSPKDIVHHMMTSIASTKKHVARFLLRVLPVEATSYTSDEEIRRVIKPVIEKYFPVETQNPRKFAVLYDARANTGIDRSKVIDAVAKSVPSVHKVDLANPDISIVVQIVKTVCLIGVVEKYKELAKYNLRQLSSSSEQQ